MNMLILKERLEAELGHQFTVEETVMFELFGNDVDCRLWVENGVLKYAINKIINFN